MDRGDVDGAVSWAAVHLPDALVLATNARIGADAFDWLAGTRSNRAFTTVIWDGTFLGHAEGVLLKRSSSMKRKALVDRVHKELYYRITEQRHIRAGGIYDSRPEEGYTSFEPPSPRFFVDREDELARLESFDSYRTAAVVAPPGFGKSMIVSRVLHTARQRGYSIVPVSFASLLRDPGPFILRLAKCLAVDHKDERLLAYVHRHGWQEIEEVALQAGTSIAQNPIFVAVDNVNAGQDNSGRPLLLVQVLASHAELSRVLFTSRVPRISTSIDTDLSIELAGFDGAAIDALFLQRRGQIAPAALKRYLVRERKGWPLLATLASSAVGTSKASRVLAESVEREAIHSITHELSSDARKLLGTLAALRLDIGADELRAVLHVSDTDLSEAWSQVELAGLARRDALMTEAVHADLRPPLREIISKPASIDGDLAQWFATFVDNVDRVSAAIDHYLLADAYIEAAELLHSRGELLIRTGHADTVLEFASRIPSEKLDSALHLQMVIVLARALSVLGRAPEALSTLQTWSFEMSYTPESAPVYRLEIARQLYIVGEFAECERETSALIEMPQTKGGTLGSAWSLLGRVRFARRDLDQAEVAYQRAQETFDSVGDAFGANKVQYRLGMIALKRDDLTMAQKLMSQVLVESRRLQDQKRESYALHRLGLIAARQRNFTKAERLFHDSISLKRGAGNVRGIVFSQYELAQMALHQGNTDRAFELGHKAFRKAEECGLRKEVAMTAGLLAIVALRRGHTGDAERWLGISVETFEHLGLHKRASNMRQRYTDASSHVPVE